MARKRWLAAAGLLGVMLLLVASALAGAATPTPPDATPAVSPSPCPLTKPNGNNPLGRRDPGGYGNAALWTTLTMWSWEPGIVIVPDDGRIPPDGVIHDMKWAWYRYKPGRLTIQGRRLDAPAPPLQAWIPEGYGDIGFQATGLTFSSAGCWEITGSLGESSLTFVVLVVTPEMRTPVVEFSQDERDPSEARATAQ